MDKFTKWLLSSARKEAEKYYDPEKMICLIIRETIWYSICLLESSKPEDLALANNILETVKANDGTHSQGTLVVIWHKYSKLLTEKAKENILKNFEDSFPISAFSRFNDGNVNHPLGAYCNLICGGEITGKNEIKEIGKHYLLEFYKCITKSYKRFKQTQLSEYNSPTYTALNIWFLNIISSYSVDDEVKRLAKKLEEMIWLDVAIHFHAPALQFSGPFSRAYLDDSIGGYSALHCTMMKALGKKIFIDPKISHRFDHPSNFIQNALVAILDFNIPDNFYEVAFIKKFPLYFKQKTFCEQYFENSSIKRGGKIKNIFDDECYPGGWSDLTTYQTDEFSLGTSERQYVNGGHTDSFVFRYRRNSLIRSMKDFRCFHTRGVYNDAIPGDDNLCHTTGYEISKSFLYEEGRNGIYQHKNRAIVSYFPKRSGCKNVKSFRTDLICGYFSEFDSISINNNTVKKFPVEFTYEDKIFIKDAKVCFAIIPFKNNKVADLKNKIWIKNDLMIISLFSYQGPERNFSRDEVNMMINGFYFEASDIGRYRNLNNFMKFFNLYKIINNSRDHIVDIEISSEDGSMKMVYDAYREKMIKRIFSGKEEKFSDFYIETNDTKFKKIPNGEYLLGEKNRSHKNI